MVTIFFSGDCWPDPDGVAAFGYAIHGLPGNTSPVCGCGVIDPAKGNTAVYAAWVALGKALALLTESKVKVEALNVVGDSQLIVNQLKGYWECAAPKLVPLRDRCRVLLGTLGVPHTAVKAECVPRGQNLQAEQLLLAAYVGRVGKLPPNLSA